VTFVQADSQAESAPAVEIVGTYTDATFTIGGSAWSPIKYDFAADEEGWTFSGAVGGFDPPVSSYGDGAIKLTAANNTNCFGFWYGPADAIGILDNDYLYRARFGVFSDQTDKSLVPTFRCRWNIANMTQGDTIMINSNMAGEASPDTTTADYDLYFRPQGTLDGLAGIPAFDIINMDSDDAADGVVACDYVYIDRVDVPTGASQVAYTFEAGANGWTQSGKVGDFDEPVFSSKDEILSMACAESNNTFGYWQNPADAIALDNDVVYEIRVKAGSAPSTKAGDPPLMRIRMYGHPSNQVIGMFQIPVLQEYITKTEDIPTTDYYAYFHNKLGVGPKLGIAIDIVNIDGDMDPNGVVEIEEVEISTFAVPTIN
jgi:hypothetical protein